MTLNPHIYAEGDVLEINGVRYILLQTGLNVFSLFKEGSCNRWDEGLTVKDGNAITKEEVIEMSLESKNVVIHKIGHGFTFNVYPVFTK